MKIYVYTTYLVDTSATAIVRAESAEEAAGKLQAYQSEQGYNEIDIDPSFFIEVDKLLTEDEDVGLIGD